MAKKLRKLLILLVLVSMMAPGAASAQRLNAPDVATTIDFTILHTNDMHGQLEAVTYTDTADGKVKTSNPGGAKLAAQINAVRTAKGAGDVLLFDGGDMMQGSLLSNLNKGVPIIDYYKTIGYNAATFGNHEFDWGQTNLNDRIAQALDTTGGKNAMGMLVANITKKDSSDNCTWDVFNNQVKPYDVFPVTTAIGTVKVGVIGVGSVETPYITIANATNGLCFRDPYEAITHYYDALNAASDVIVVLSHNGFEDGGYGYGFSVYGDKTLAAKLISAGKPVDMIIGGHSHTKMSAASVVTVSGKPGQTTVAQAYYNGRYIGQADMKYDPAAGTVAITWSIINLYQKEAATLPDDPTVSALIGAYTSNPAYQTKITEEIGWSKVDMARNPAGDNMLASFIDDAIYNQLNTDTNPNNDVDMFFNNAGGLRADLCVGGTCVAGVKDSAFLLNYGMMFNVLPFGNATVTGTMKGSEILDVINYGPQVSNGVIQPSGIHYKYYEYKDGSTLYAWGAYDVCVVNKSTKACDPLDLNKTYKVGTNEFLAPAGGDGYNGFKYMQNISYWGDMLDSVNAWVKAQYTSTTPYMGPSGDGSLDKRIEQDGDGDYTYDKGEIVPVTIMHNNDSHGNLVKTGTYTGLTQLASLITTERAHNPGRTLLVSLGDAIQGDSMMYYFKSAGLGYSADGQLLDPAMRINPMVAAMNQMKYDAMVLGNHEFNFGSEVFGSTFSKASFPILGANLSDSGAYGINKSGILGPMEPLSIDTSGPKVNVYDGEVITLGTLDAANPVKIGLLGLTNHRVPNYELPSNIPGLAFTNPIDTAKSTVPTLRAESDAVVALTHIGFTTNPKSVEVDNNVDTNLAAQVSGIDAIIGSHSHTNPAAPEAPYKALPVYITNPDGEPVLVNQAYRFNTYLGEVILGLRPKDGGGYEVVTKAARDMKVDQANQPEDPTLTALLQPYVNKLAAYNNTVLGKTTQPIDTTNAYTAETNAANMQADASVAELALNGIKDVDFHISGAMTRPSSTSNWVMFKTATDAAPVTLQVSDMFTLMPY
jgi:2',3'-cyclic-nucleotide 2'-phosphodiesterase (5'-nucleotidase family)